MKVYEDKKLLKYVLKYIQHGNMLGYFNNVQSELIYNKLVNLEISISNNSNDYIKIENGKLVLNFTKLNCLSSELDQEFCFAIFKEFTSFCSGLNSFNELSKINIRNIMTKYFNYDYDFTYSDENKEYALGDANNPYSYFQYGFNFLNEVISQIVSVNMVNSLFNLRKQKKQRTRSYTKPVLKYFSSFEYCGLGESIVEQFLKITGRVNNLQKVCKLVFKKDFLEDVLINFIDNEEKCIDIFRVLSYMGILYYAEEFYYGNRYNKISLSKNFVHNAYNEINKILINLCKENSIKKSR